ALLLSDARERAQRILDDSIDRATELLTSQRRAAPPEGIEAVRRSIAELAANMEDVERRLGHIEDLLEPAPRMREPSRDVPPTAAQDFAPPPRAAAPPPT